MKLKTLLDPAYRFLLPGQRIGLRRRLAVFAAAMRVIKWNPFRRMVIFDVGANDGLSFIDLPRIMPNVQIYAFEPTPELADKIREQFAVHTNYHLVETAIGEVEEITQFNVADKGDGGCSSLLGFSRHIRETWAGREDLVVTRKINVRVTRLDSFVIANSIAKIDFLHVDTQGTDLSVLRSLGRELNRVQSGVIEVPRSRDVMLYENQHTTAVRSLKDMYSA